MAEELHEPYYDGKACVPSLASSLPSKLALAVDEPGDKSLKPSTMSEEAVTAASAARESEAEETDSKAEAELCRRAIPDNYGVHIAQAASTSLHGSAALSPPATEPEPESETEPNATESTEENEHEHYDVEHDAELVTDSQAEAEVEEWTREENLESESVPLHSIPPEEEHESVSAVLEDWHIRAVSESSSGAADGEQQQQRQQRQRQADEVVRLSGALQQAQQEAEALEVSLEHYRQQLKHTRESQREMAVNALSVEEALQRETAALKMLEKAQGQTERLVQALQQKEEEITQLNIAKHAFPSRILMLQEDLAEEKKKFQNLVDRFNNVKELELHRQRQRFMAVSHKQKEVFMKLKEKYQTASQTSHRQHQRIEDLVLQLRQAQGSITTLNERIELLQLESNAVGADKRSSEVHFVEERRDLIAKLSARDGEVVALSLQLKEARDVAAAAERAATAQARMQLRIECSHGDAPELGDELLARASNCGELSEVRWFRSFAGSAFTPIDGAHGDVYTTRADDIGAVIRARCFNTAAQKCDVEIGPVSLPDKIAFTLHDLLLSKKDVAFRISSLSIVSSAAMAQGPGSRSSVVGGGGSGGKMEQLTLLLTKDKLKLRSGRRTQQKAEFSSALSISLDGFNEHVLSVTFDASSVPLSFSFDTTASRDLAALTIRCAQLLHIGRIVYKEKEPNLLWLQFVAATSTLRYVTGQGVDLGTRRRRHSQSQSLSRRNFSFHRSSVLVVPNQQRSSGSKLGALGSSSLNEDASVISDYPMPIDAAKASSVPPLPSRRNQSSPPSLEPTMEAAAPADDIKYDADGYIIRRDSTFGFDNYYDAGGSDGGSDGNGHAAEHTLAADPIVIKPADEAVEASHEELSRAVLQLSRPPPPSSNTKSKKGAAAAVETAKTAAVKSERRKKKGAKKKKKQQPPKDRAGKPADLTLEPPSSQARQQNIQFGKETEESSLKAPSSLGAANLTVSTTSSGVDAVTAPDSAPALSGLRSPVSISKRTPSSAPTEAEAATPVEAEAKPEARRRRAVSTHLVVNEVLNCVIGGGGELQELAAIGTVSLLLSPAPAQELTVPFELDNTERIAELIVNESFVSETSENVFEVRASGDVGSISALRYSISLREAELQQAPLNAEVACDATLNTVRLKLRRSAWLPSPSSVSILLGIDGDLDVLLSSTPGCMFDAPNRRLCWKAVPMQEEFEAHLGGGGGGGASQLRVVSCLLQFSCAQTTLSGIEALIDPDPMQRYVSTATQRQLCSRPFKAF